MTQQISQRIRKEKVLSKDIFKLETRVGKMESQMAAMNEQMKLYTQSLQHLLNTSTPSNHDDNKKGKNSVVVSKQSTSFIPTATIKDSKQEQL